MFILKCHSLRCAINFNFIYSGVTRFNVAFVIHYVLAAFYWLWNMSRNWNFWCFYNGEHRVRWSYWYQLFSREKFKVKFKVNPPHHSPDSLKMFFFSFVSSPSLRNLVHEALEFSRKLKINAQTHESHKFLSKSGIEPETRRAWWVSVVIYLQPAICALKYFLTIFFFISHIKLISHFTFLTNKIDPITYKLRYKPPVTSHTALR